MSASILETESRLDKKRMKTWRSLESLTRNHRANTNLAERTTLTPLKIRWRLNCGQKN